MLAKPGSDLRRKLKNKQHAHALSENASALNLKISWFFVKTYNYVESITKAFKIIKLFFVYNKYTVFFSS